MIFLLDIIINRHKVSLLAFIQNLLKLAKISNVVT